MTPHEALALIDSVLQQVRGTRADHDRLKEAIVVLSGAIDPTETDQTGHSTL